MKFSELNLQKNVLKALAEAGYEEPTPVQEQAIPALMEGRDVLACAQTGTGKTCAFAVPIIETLSARREGKNGRFDIRALILTPTRELALQIYENACQYARYTNCVSAVIYGGVPQGAQVQAIRRGVDILIATPGRLWDLIEQGIVKLGNVEFFVLDEADRMLDMGFFPDVKRIVKKVPQKRQTMLFSATMPEEIASLADSMLRDPVHISVVPSQSTAELIEQQMFYVDKPEKKELLIELLRDKNVSQALVFTRTKSGADRVTRELTRAGMKARAIHGDKTQSQRQRALSDFKKLHIGVLVATDIAARGIDISDLPLVINFDIPDVAETYVHRIGRTGRAGHEGIAISFCDRSERAYVRDIQKLLGKEIPTMMGEPVTMEERIPKRGPTRRSEGQRKKPVATNRVPRGKEAPRKNARAEQSPDKQAPRTRDAGANIKARQAETAPEARQNNASAQGQGRQRNSAQNKGNNNNRRRRGGMRSTYEDKDERRYDAHTPTKSDKLSREARARIQSKVQSTLNARTTQSAAPSKNVKRTDKNASHPRRNVGRRAK